MTEKKKRRIPPFKNIKEEAAFWDSHDTMDYESEFRPVNVRFARRLEHILAVRFDAKTLDELQRQADRKGIGPTTLVRMLVRKHLYS